MVKSRSEELSFRCVHMQPGPGGEIIKTFRNFMEAVTATIKEDHDVIREHQVGYLQVLCSWVIADATRFVP